MHYLTLCVLFCKGRTHVHAAHFGCADRHGEPSRELDGDAVMMLNKEQSRGSQG
jgi:hypothetical protein